MPLSFMHLPHCAPVSSSSSISPRSSSAKHLKHLTQPPLPAAAGKTELRGATAAIFPKSSKPKAGIQKIIHFKPIWASSQHGNMYCIAHIQDIHHGQTYSSMLGRIEKGLLQRTDTNQLCIVTEISQLLYLGL